MHLRHLLLPKLLLLLTPLTLLAGEYPPVDVSMELKQVSEHVWMVQGQAGMASDNAGFISNASAIVTDAGVVIVDTLGSPSLAVLFLSKLREVTEQPITTVILTHYHADHIYGLQVFKELGATVIAPAGAWDYLDSPAAKDRLDERRLSLDPWVNDDTRLVAPDRVIDANQTLTIGGVTLTLSYLGSAHSDGDLSVLVQPDQVLLSGDIIFEGRLPWVGDADTAHWLTVLQQLQQSGPKALVPGHGPVATDPAASVGLTVRYLQTLRGSMGNAVEEMTPFAEAYEDTDWGEFAQLPAFPDANRRNAYGVYLGMERESLQQDGD